jgi:hypothetical protein
VPAAKIFRSKAGSGVLRRIVRSCGRLIRVHAVGAADMRSAALSLYVEPEPGD